MNPAELLDPSMHVRLTREFMDEELRLDRLLELTHGLASAGSAALQLVLPAVAKTVQPNWGLLTGVGVSGMPVGDMGEWLARGLATLDAWTSPRIDAVFDAAAGAFGSSGTRIRSLVSVLVLGELTPLPVAAVLEVMGQERSLVRLRAATRAFKVMQMVG